MADPPPPHHAEPRLLVLGATSLIGPFLLSRLIAAAAQVEAVTRNPFPPTAHGVPPDVRWRTVDLTDGSQVRELDPAAAVVSLSPIWLLPAALPSLADLGVRRVVAFSSTSRLTKIDAPIAAERLVAERLAWGEDETMRQCDRMGIAWTLFRPTLIYAEGQDRNISRLADLIARFGVLPLSGAGLGLRQPVHAGDLAWAAQRVLEASETFGRIYALPGGETLSYRALVERLFESLGRPPRIISIAPWAWRLGLTLATPLLPGATTAMGARMSRDLTFDPRPAHRDFGWSPRPFRPQFPQRRRRARA